MTILNAYMDELRAELTSHDIMTRDWTAQDMFNGQRSWLTSADVSQMIYPNTAKMLLLRTPMTIYVHEHQDGGTYDVLRGGEVVETLRAVMKMPKDGQEALHRRIINLPITVVIFRASMSHKDADRCADMLAL